MVPSSPPKNSAPASPTPAAASSQSKSPSYGYGREESGSSTPPRPPFSPITPVASRAQPVAIDPADRVVPPGASFVSQPPSVPIQDEENTDVLALCAAISILQVQRDKSKRDMITLEQMKKTAVADPDTFLQGIMARRDSAAAEDPLPGLLGPTLADAVADLIPHKLSEADPDSAKRTEHDKAQDSSSSPSPPSDASSSAQPLMPQPQNIYRCPPINWAKYHIVGEPLDKLHAQQLQRPIPGEPQLDRLGRAPPYVMAAPYSPWSDKLAETHQTQTRKRSKKPVSR